ncbi:hypothetical protein VTL71DRAFT_1003 [Oculimacula yallundae]|uniref:Uncharacterized protein n=1 Tax=Oculimacula yallundae TaxID=86028 RepID=A0ABR4D1M6_9HELO
MIQHASATTRLCARRAFSQIWHLQSHMPIASRSTLKAGKDGWHSPITRIANTSHPRHRSLSTSTRQLERAEEAVSMAPRKRSYVQIEEGEDSKAAVVRMETLGLSPQVSRAAESDSTPDSQTIYAISTGAGRAAIAVIRISGPACKQICLTLCPTKKLPQRRYATVRTLYHPTDRDNILDSDALVLLFDGPNTATGEDMLELHVHGGPATVKAVMSALSEIDPKAIRAAAPGEFTRRAFDNEKLDLGQIESLGDTLSAETELQRRAALRGRSGELSRIYEGWRHSLIEELAHAAADTDHSEDHSLDNMEGIWPRIIEKVTKMQDEMLLHQTGAKRGSLLRKGIQVSLIGKPNAGKSSLFNLIVGRAASIVNQQAGTTRDVIEATIDYEGYLCTFADTAGVRATDFDGTTDIGAIEEEGIKRAMMKAADADVIVYVAAIEADSGSPTGYSVPVMEDLVSVIQVADGVVKPLIIVVNKIDKASPEEVDATVEIFLKTFYQFIRASMTTVVHPYPINYVSASKAEAGLVKESNIRGIATSLIQVFEKMTNMPIESEHLLGVTERQGQLLKSCSSHLGDFVAEASRATPPPDNSIATLHLELAAKCLAEMTGRFEGAGDVDEILGVVFSKYVPSPQI